MYVRRPEDAEVSARLEQMDRKRRPNEREVEGRSSKTENTPCGLTILETKVHQCVLSSKVCPEFKEGLFKGGVCNKVSLPRVIEGTCAEIEMGGGMDNKL